MYTPTSVSLAAEAASAVAYSVTFPEGEVNVTFVTVVSFLGSVVASSSVSLIVTAAEACFTKSTVAPLTVV